jgi:hypothetical protein
MDMSSLKTKQFGRSAPRIYPPVLATLYIRSKTRKETASEKPSRHWLDVKMTRKKEQVETSVALIFGTDIQSSQHRSLAV